VVPWIQLLGTGEQVSRGFDLTLIEGAISGHLIGQSRGRNGIIVHCAGGVIVVRWATVRGGVFRGLPFDQRKCFGKRVGRRTINLGTPLVLHAAAPRRLEQCNPI
jgi:hypothetical protein